MRDSITNKPATITVKYKRTYYSVYEQAILNFLAVRLDKVVKSQDIIRYVWGKSPYGTERNLVVRISKLRNKLKNAPKGQTLAIYQVKDDRVLIGYVLRPIEIEQRQS